MEGWKKDKIKGSKGKPNYDDGEMGSGGSDDGEENVVRPPPVTAATTNINTKKRVKLNGKVADDCVAVVAVPRKLRSAIHKRSNGSPSPPVPSARSYKGISGLRMFKQNKVTDSLTKDEEEVIETLSVLSSIATDTKLNDNGIGRRLQDENVNTKAMNLIVISQADRTTKEPEVQTTPIDLEDIGTSSCMESLEGAKRAKSSTAKDVFEHSGVDFIVQSSFQNIDLESTGVYVVDSLKSTPIHKSENLLQLSSGITISNQNSALLQTVPFDGKFQHSQLEVLPQKPEIRFPPALDSAPTRQEMKLSKEKSQKVTCREEAASDTWNMKPVNRAHGSLTESFSTKMEARKESACSASLPDSRVNDVSTEKFVLDSACGRESWKKCATHVYISHLVRNHQNAEKNQQWSFPAFHVKLKEGRESGAVAISKSTEWKNGLTKPSTSDSYSSTPDNRIDLRTGMQHNRRLHPDPRHPTTCGVYSQPKPMVDFLSLSACGEHGTSGKTTESLGHLPVAYLHSLPPNHHMIPFSLAPGHYPSHYTEQLAAQQLPHYVGHPFYGLHMGGVSSAQQQQQQQQMWQAHLTNYRQKIASKWQNTSLVPCPIPSSSSMENQGVIQRSTNPHIRPQIFAVPFPDTTNNMKRHHQQTNPNHPGSFNQAGAILPEGSAQLQVLCSAQRM